MKRTLLAGLLALSYAAPSFACDCDKKGGSEPCNHEGTAANAPAAGFKELEVADVAKLVGDEHAAIYDANMPEFRAQNGVVPGAKLLTNAMNYDPAKELPAAKDTKLVFYCANTHCRASHMAANKAVQAGYTDVAVMPAGLMGWKNAGQKTSSVPQS